MDAQSDQKSSKFRAGTMPAPLCVHVYVWAFMIMLGIVPILGPLSASIARGNTFGPLLTVGLIQVWFWCVQRLCSTDALSYWDGLLAAAFSVMGRGHFGSFVRASWLLLGVVILSILYATCHNGRSAERHAGLRYSRLIIWLYWQRPARDSARS